jgi:hypothetical protein
MHRLIALAIASIVLAQPCAAKDLFYALMRLEDGKKELHWQAMPSDQCDKTMDEFRKVRDAGNHMVLTMKDPEVTGTVLEVYCIRPDGTIWGPDGMVHLPDPPAK